MHTYWHTATLLSFKVVTSSFPSSSPPPQNIKICLDLFSSWRIRIPKSQSVSDPSNGQICLWTNSQKYRLWKWETLLKALCRYCWVGFLMSSALGRDNHYLLLNQNNCGNWHAETQWNDTCPCPFSHWQNQDCKPCRLPGVCCTSVRLPSHHLRLNMPEIKKTSIILFSKTKKK